MTDPRKRIEEELDRPLTNLEHIACELEWLRQDVESSNLAGRIQDIEAYLEEARDEDKFRRKRIAELEEALRPFAQYYHWALRNEWPENIAKDKSTPVLGRVNWHDDRGFDSFEVYISDFLRAALLLSEQTETPVEETAQHPDDAAVDRFASALKAKLARKRDEGRGGWDDPEQCSAQFLSRLLREHVEKGDPIDVGAFAMMLQQRGEPIQSAAPAQETGGDVGRVAKAISPYLQRSYSGTNPDVDDQARGRDTALHVAGLAIAAMRPVSVDAQKLAEIRGRHDSEELDWFPVYKTGWLAEKANQAHADRAFLLSALEGVKP